MRLLKRNQKLKIHHYQQTIINKTLILQLLMMSTLAIFTAVTFLLLSKQKQLIHYPDDFILIQRINRDASYPSQGIHYINSTHFIESSGFYGNSEIHYMNQGNITQSILLDEQYQSQGIDIINGEIYQLTWREKTIFIREIQSLEIKDIQDINLNTMIGIAHSNENEIFISDGSDTIFILDSDFAIESSLRVKFENGTYIEGIGDMVWLDGLLYAVSVSKRLIFVIDLYEGLITKYYDLELMLEGQSGIPKGIAYNFESELFLITGDRWPYIMEVELN